jgi:hypothetical protein
LPELVLKDGKDLFDVFGVRYGRTSKLDNFHSKSRLLETNIWPKKASGASTQ